MQRDFTADAPNKLWVADATRIPTGEGVFWLAAVPDAFSKGALGYGIWSRDIRDGQLIHHSDRGSAYTAFRFANRLADNGIDNRWDRSVNPTITR
ncbi:DDE-type integrase/transposase/recombinase [Nocardia arizonensis]|uniref:DDE-type integrase/transposase/recombinase n=1 Tax=Nocardia arizonensis TaxID=1141647 RepID=UPI000ADEE405|nr:hypothetical protein [Nocardia arizonensis]